MSEETQSADEGEDAPKGVTEREARDIEERAQPRAPVIYEVVRRQGEEELSRPAISLWWSGVAAGLSMGFSPLTEAMLSLSLPDTRWRPLAVSLGYPVGFLMSILSRQQLFTENTITVVLPLMRETTLVNLLRLLRLWTIVLLANFFGALCFVLFVTFTPALRPELLQSMLEVSRSLIEGGFFEMFARAIPSGFMIATMVWMLPNADVGKAQIVALITYVIGIGGFTHIVAGSVEAFLLTVNGELSVAHMLTGFMIPALCGNIVGGTALFAMITYGQVMSEI